MSNSESKTHEVSAEDYKRFRLRAILLELVPILLILLSFLINNKQLKILGFSTTSLIYLFAGWYLFKAAKYKVWDILWATFFGLLIAVHLVGILFYSAELPGGEEMLMVGYIALLAGLFFSIGFLIIKYAISKNKEYEFTMSLKVFSRFLILFLLSYVMGWTFI